MNNENVVYCTLQKSSNCKEYGIVLFASKGIELRNITLSEVSQTQKNRGHAFFHNCDNWLPIFRFKSTLKEWQKLEKEKVGRNRA